MATAACKLEDRFSLMRNREVNQPAKVGAVGVPVVTSALPGSEEQVLSALSSDSLTNVIMSGFIRDNGLVNPFNRGRFYVCRDENNKLEGVALLGHTILFEAFSDRAIEAFAMLARRESSTHLLMGEHNAVERFWSYYTRSDQSPRLVCPIVFLEGTGPFTKQPVVSGLRPALRQDLEHVVRAQAAMALETSGVDPLEKDPEGFGKRYLRRIEKQRVWVLIEEDRLLFKADVLADTPEANYIEGVYVTPEERGKGLGRRCLATLGQRLLDRTKRIYLFVENDDARTKSFYLKLGFRVAVQYDLLYF